MSNCLKEKCKWFNVCKGQVKIVKEGKKLDTNLLLFHRQNCLKVVSLGKFMKEMFNNRKIIHFSQ